MEHIPQFIQPISLNGQHLATSATAQAAALRPVFENSTFNIYAHLEPKDLRPMLTSGGPNQPNVATAIAAAPSNMMSYRMIDPLTMQQYDASTKQPQFVHAYNRLIFQNPRFQNIQHLVVPTYTYPFAVRQHPYATAAASTTMSFLHGGAPMAVMERPQMGHFITRKSLDTAESSSGRMRHLRKMPELPMDYSSSEQWDRESSASSHPYVLMKDNKGDYNESNQTFNAIKKRSNEQAIAVNDFSESNNKTEPVESNAHVNSSIEHLSSNAITKTQTGGDEMKSENVEEVNTEIPSQSNLKADEIQQTPRKQDRRESSPNVSRQKSYVGARHGHTSKKTANASGHDFNRNTYHHSLTKKNYESYQNFKDQNKSMHRVHERPLYERYQEAFRDSVRRGDYWRHRSTRQMRFSDNANVQIFPQMKNTNNNFDNRMMAQPLPLEYLPVSMDPIALQVRAAHTIYPYNQQPQAIPPIAYQLPQVTADYLNYRPMLASNDMVRMQRKLCRLRRKVHSMKKELILVKSKADTSTASQVEPNKTRKSNVSNETENRSATSPNREIYQDKQDNSHQQHPKIHGARFINRYEDEINASSNYGKNRSKSLQAERRKSSSNSRQHGGYTLTSNQMAVGKQSGRQITRHISPSRHLLKNKGSHAYKWANAPPPPPLSQNMNYLNYEGVSVNECPTFCALHDSSDSNESTDLSSTDKFIFSTVGRCISPSQILYPFSNSMKRRYEYGRYALSASERHNKFHEAGSSSYYEKKDAEKFQQCQGQQHQGSSLTSSAGKEANAFRM